MHQHRTLGEILSACVLAALLAMTLTPAASQAADTTPTVSEGKNVSLEYTLKLDDKSVVESNVGKQPLTYTHGTRQIIPGLEKALEGLAVGDTKEVTVAPAEAYGEQDPNAIARSAEEVDLPMRSSLGARLQGKAPDGHMVYPRWLKSKTTQWCSISTIPWRGKRYISMSRYWTFNRISRSHRTLPKEEVRVTDGVRVRQIDCASRKRDIQQAGISLPMRLTSSRAFRLGLAFCPLRSAASAYRQRTTDFRRFLGRCSGASPSCRPDAHAMRAGGTSPRWGRLMDIRLTVAQGRTCFFRKRLRQDSCVLHCHLRLAQLLTAGSLQAIFMGSNLYSRPSVGQTSEKCWSASVCS